MRFDRLWRGARLATLAPGNPGLGFIENGAIASRGGRIAFLGPESELSRATDTIEEIDLEGRLVTPGLIDCHTHLIFAGDRSDEFEQRLAGADYQAISRAGGGILATVRATRRATERELVASAAARLRTYLAEGVTTIEIKSGYGLDLETELRMLRAARAIGREYPIDVVTTLLAAHTAPPDVDRRAFLALVNERLIPLAAAENLVDAVDGYCEAIGFAPSELCEVFASARLHDIPVKVHADQLSNSGGAALAAEWQALSADHLEWTDEEGVAALARAGTVAVLLPGAFFALRECRVPPIASLRNAGARIAVATDCNPGTSPLISILTAVNMAAVQFGLTVEESIAAVTREAAYALGRQEEVGTLELGKRADLAIWNLERPAELVYWLGHKPLHSRIWRGE
jgi:imidazolonepropionase